MIFNNVITESQSGTAKQQYFRARVKKFQTPFFISHLLLEYAYILGPVGVNYQHLTHKNTSVSSFCCEGRYGSNLFVFFCFISFVCVCFFFLCVVFADCYVSFLEEKRIILTKPIT